MCECICAFASARTRMPSCRSIRSKACGQSHPHRALRSLQVVAWGALFVGFLRCPCKSLHSWLTRSPVSPVFVRACICVCMRGQKNTSEVVLPNISCVRPLKYYAWYVSLQSTTATGGGRRCPCSPSWLAQVCSRFPPVLARDLLRVLARASARHARTHVLFEVI